MSYVLFLIYLAFFSWLLTKSRFVLNSGISAKIVIALFVLKVITGCVHAWIMMQLANVPDTMVFHSEGLIEYHLLFNHPKEYVSNFFRSNYDSGYGSLLSSNNSYWNDLTSNLIIKFLSVCDIFSFGYYKVNVIFYNFVIFFGAIGLYRVFDMVFANNKYLLIITCFLLPSVLFYSSTIHKEGLIFAAIGIAVYNIYTALHTTGFTPKRIIYIIVALAFIFFQRNYVLLAFLPAAFAWILCERKKLPALFTFIIIYIAGAILFFNTAFLSPSLNLPEAVSKKQWDFMHLPPASTAIQLNTLEPSFKGYAANALQALNHSLLRPYLSDYTLSPFLLPLSVELFFYELLLVIFIFFRKKMIVKNSFILFGLFFSLSILLIIGYTIPIIGAIVRYRSIYLSFILTPIVCNINWGKLQRVLQIKK